MYTFTPVSVSLSEVQPKWYLTSPSNTSSLKSLPSNSLKIPSTGLPKILVRTFSLPLCAIPKVNSLTPNVAALSTKVSKAGIKDSPPSKENLF